MAETTKIIIELDLDEKTARSEFNKVEKQADKAGKSIGDKLGGGASGATGLGVALGGISTAFIAAGAAAVGAVAAVGKFTDAANTQQDAVNRLNASLQRIGEFSNSTSQEIQDFASQLQNTSRVGDEVILSNIALAQSLGATADQSKELVAAALDLSAATGQELESATRQIAKTFSGLQGEIGENVTEIRELTAEQLKAGAAIDVVAQKFAGFAEKEAATFSGSLDQLSNSFGDLLEEIGFFITQSDTLAPIISGLTDLFKSASTFLREFRLENEELSKTNADAKLALVTKETKELNEELKDLREGGNTLGRLFSDAGGNAAEIQKVTNRLKELGAEEAKIRQFIKDNPEPERKKIKDEVLKSQKELNDLRIQALQLGADEFDQLQLRFDQETKLLSEALKARAINQAEFNDIRLELERDFFEQRKAIVEANKPEEDPLDLARLDNFSEGLDDFATGFTDSFTKIGQSAQQAGASIAGALSGQAVNAIGNFGLALGRGEDASNAFLDGLKNVFSSAASIAGDFFIKLGLAKLFINPAVGGGLIAGGIALKALSGIIGGAGSEPASGRGGGSLGAQNDVFAEDPEFVAATQSDTQERLEPRTVINVNVDNVLGDEASGAKIVDLINANFESEGGVIINNGNFA